MKKKRLEAFCPTTRIKRERYHKEKKEDKNVVISNTCNEIHNSVQVNIFTADNLCQQQICICNRCILRLIRDAK